MGTSIYYTAKRVNPLTPVERTTIGALMQRFSVGDRFAQHGPTGVGPNGEDFCVYDPDQPTERGVIFEGATRLSDSSPDAMWEDIRHWSTALTEIRRVLPDADWRVHVDGRDIPWNEERWEYDPGG